jgi:hypothetical protein
MDDDVARFAAAVEAAGARESAICILREFNDIQFGAARVVPPRRRCNRSDTPTLIRRESERCVMVEVKELIRQANELYERAKREEDPSIRDRLNRMADTYSHMAEIESGAAPPSVHGLMDALANPDNGTPTERSNARPEPPGPGSMKQTNEPWKQPVEKEQDPGRVSADELERWQKTNTH